MLVLVGRTTTRLPTGVEISRPMCTIFLHQMIKGNISGGNQHLHVNYGNFNLSHAMLIQRGAQRRWEE
jgi:hypothetical protein